jgi:hypothetical protein
VLESTAFTDLSAAQLTFIKTIEFRADSFMSAYASGSFIFHDAVIPEPATSALLLAGMAGLAVRRRLNSPR